MVALGVRELLLPTRRGVEGRSEGRATRARRVSVVVELSVSSLARVKVEADRRRAESRSMGLTDVVDEPWPDECRSCGAELAVSIWRGELWRGEGKKRAKGRPDVGRDIEVKCSRWPESGLRIRQHDERAQRRFVLVTSPEVWGPFEIRAWLPGADADRLGRFMPNGRPPYWLVPQYKLRPIEEMTR